MVIPRLSVPLLLIATAALAEQSGPTDPERRIPYFAGDWTFTGTMNGIAFGPDQPDTRIAEHCEMLGPAFLVCDYEIRQPGASLKGLGVFGYDRVAGKYFFTSYESNGRTIHSTPRPQGDRWTVLTSTGDVKTQWKELTPRSYQIEVQNLQNGTWVTIMEGIYTKPGG